MFSEKEKKILKAHGVNPEQYFLWAMMDAGKQAFLWGVCLSTVFFILMLLSVFSSYSSHRSSNEKDITLYFGLGMAVFIYVMFLFVAVKLKKSAYNDTSDSETLASKLLMISVLRKMDVLYLRKISDAKWDRIRELDLEAFQKQQQAIEAKKQPLVNKNAILELKRVKKIFKKCCIYSLVLFCLLLLATSFFKHDIVYAAIFFLLLVAYDLGNITFIFHALIGLLEKKVLVEGEFQDDDTIITGSSAVICASVLLVLGLISFVLVNLGVIFLLFYRFILK